MEPILLAVDSIYGLLFVVAAVLAALPAKRDLGLARQLTIFGAVLMAGRWGVWAFTTDAHWVTRAVVGALIGAALFALLPATLHWLNVRDAESSTPVKPSDPVAPQLSDVTLRLVFPLSPGLMLDNNSSVVAKQIKWTVVLWNLDQPKAYSGNPGLPADAHEPLQIPISTFDFIMPHSAGGPQNLFGGPLVVPHVKKGDRLFGSASVVCPECARGHSYLIFIEYGHGGWTHEVKERKDGTVLIPNPLTITSVRQYYERWLSQIPEKDRVPIRGL